MMSNNLFENIMENRSEKKIVGCCKKLIKKSSLTSGATASTLAELAYWLYVYGYENDALKVCEFSHIEDSKPNKVNYNVWDFIIFIWGLEAYIYFKRNDTENMEKRIQEMQRIWRIPTGVMNKVEKREELQRKIQNRTTFEDVTRKEEIENAEKRKDFKSANNWKFIALFKMIGYGVTGLYPKLEENKEILEKKIDEYIRDLRKYR